MKFSAKEVVKYVALLAFAVALLFFAFRNMSWADFVASLQRCNFWWVAAMISLSWIITFWRGLRWRLLLLPLNGSVTRREAYDAYAICYLANLAFPRSGEVVRCGLLASRGCGSFEGILGTVVLERTWDMVCMCLMAIPLLFVGRFKEYLIENMWKPLFSRFGWGLLLIVFGVLMIIWGLYLILRHRKASSKLGKWIAKLWRGLIDGLKAGFKMEHKWAFFGLTALIWVGYLFTSYLLIQAFPDLHFMNLEDALLLMTVGAFGWVLPVPGGFGVYHTFLSATLVIFYGLSQNDSLLFATVSHESQILQMLLCGLISLISVAAYKRKKSKI